MTIKKKLILLGLLTLVTLLVLTGLTRYKSTVSAEIHQSALLEDQLEIDMLTLRRHEKDFLARLDLKYQARFNEQLEITLTNIAELQQRLDDLGVELDLGNLDAVFRDYRQRFNELVELKVQVGLNAKEGLYGKLRDAVHGAEEAVREQRDSTLLAGILMLRRAEKDFMLRNDTKYLDKFEASLASALAGMEMSHLPANQQRRVTEALNNYAKDFRALVAAQQQIGLSPSEGMRGEMRATIQQSETMLAETKAQLTEFLHASERRLELIIWSIFALAVIGLLGLITWLTASILKPLGELARCMQQITETRDLKIRANANSHDELGDMAGHFNAMLDAFQHTVHEVVSASEQMSAAAEELSAITTQTSAGIGQQRQDVDLVATAMMQMGATLEEVAGNTEMAASSAQEADRRAQHGIEVVDKSIQRVYSMAEYAKKAESVAKALEENSANIVGVLDVIKTISEQTNLLALNAAIEAARAGDQGRGFAVVADEVRVLAQRTQDSAGEIEEMMDALHQGTQSVVSVIQESSAIADEGVHHARDASGSLTEITAAIAQIKAMSTQIAAATEEQVNVANDINQNIVNIKTVTDEAASAAEQSAAAGCQVAEQAHRLHDNVKHFNA
ncbi:methyl-accepting chemotaxis protein [Motiliproteus sp. SC1-56]|uniref:methyl-accepting chemotaxis protein n=1 Tax=Motiliproteus sp. SC1-56 TaxID=2799565 RepID=UPI001A8F628D|nr:methyl-accepting chemotaxis protein [Motiliproteus sp. SC1-56]